MLDRNYYVICDSGCKFESMTKEQILTAITQAVSEGTVGDIDTGFITRVKTVNGIGLRFFVGTQSEYELLSEEDRQNLFAIITNDTTKESIMSALEENKTNIEALAEYLVNLISALDDGSMSHAVRSLCWLHGGSQKNNLDFISDDGRWNPDPCGNYFSYGSADIETVNGTESITGWQLKGFHIVDDYYLQLLITQDKMFIRTGFKDSRLGRTFTKFIQIAGSGTSAESASKLNNKIYADISGEIQVTETGVYMCIYKKADEDQYYTTSIVIHSLYTSNDILGGEYLDPIVRCTNNKISMMKSGFTLQYALKIADMYDM